MDIIPYIEGLSNYLVSIKSLADFPIQTVEGAAGKTIAIQGNDLKYRYLLNFAFPNRPDIIEKYLVPLAATFRVCPFINLINEDLPHLIGEHGAITPVGLEEIRATFNTNQTELLSVAITAIPINKDAIGGSLKFHRSDYDTFSPLPKKNTYLYKAIEKVIAKAEKLDTTETKLKYITTSPDITEQKGIWDTYTFDKSAVVGKTLSLKNHLSTQPIEGSNLPLVQYSGFGGLDFSLTIRDKYDNPELTENIKSVVDMVKYVKSKPNPFKSAEAIKIDDILPNAIGFSRKNNSSNYFVCYRVTSASIEANTVEYDLLFAESDIDWMKDSNYIIHHRGLSQEVFDETFNDLKRNAENFLGGGYSGKAEEEEMFRVFWPATPEDLEIPSLSSDRPNSVINKESLNAALSTIYKDALLKTETTSTSLARRGEGLFGGNVAALAGKGRSVFNNLATGTTLEYFDSVNAIPRQWTDAVYNFYSGRRNRGYEELIGLLTSKKIKPKKGFWDILREVIKDRQSPDLRIRNVYDITGLSRSFELIAGYAKLQGKLTNDKPVNVDLYPSLLLPTFQSLYGVDAESKLIEVLGTYNDFGRISNKKRPSDVTDKVPPYAFFAWKSKKPTAEDGGEDSGYAAQLEEQINDDKHSLELSVYLDKQEIARLREDNPGLPETLETYIKDKITSSDKALTEASKVVRGFAARAARAETNQTRSMTDVMEDYYQAVRNGKVSDKIVLHCKYTGGGASTVVLGNAKGAALQKKLIEALDVFNPEDTAEEYLESVASLGKSGHTFNSKEYKKDLYERAKQETPNIYKSPARLFPIVKVFFATPVGHPLFRTYHLTGFDLTKSVKVTLDKDDAGLAVIELADPMGLLTTRWKLNKKSSYEEGKRILYHLSDEELIKSVLEIGQTLADKNVIIKGGYGGHYEYLDTLFTGKVTEVGAQSYVTVVAQDYKAELYNQQVEFYSSADDDLNIQSHVARLIQKANPEGFGAYIPEYDYQVLRDWVPGIKTSRSVSRSRTIQQGATTINTYGNYVGLDLRLRNVWAPRRNINKLPYQWLNNLKDSADPDVGTSAWNVPRQSLWKALKEASRHTWDYVVDVRPFDSEATIYFGKPDGMYTYTDDIYSSGKTINRSDEYFESLKEAHLKDWLNSIEGVGRFISNTKSNGGRALTDEEFEKLARGQLTFDEYFPINKDALLRIDALSLGYLLNEQLAIKWEQTSEIMGNYSWRIFNTRIVPEEAPFRNLVFGDMEQVGTLIHSFCRGILSREQLITELNNVYDSTQKNIQGRIEFLEERRYKVEKRLGFGIAMGLSQTRVMPPSRTGGTTPESLLREGKIDRGTKDLLLRFSSEISRLKGLLKDSRDRVRLEQVIPALANIQLSTYKSVSEKYKNITSKLSNTLKPFRKYLWASDDDNIIGNNITASEREMANTILINHPKDNTTANVSTFLFGLIELENRVEENITIPPASEWEYFPTPEKHHVSAPGLSWHPANLSTVRLMKTVQELNATQEDVAAKLACTNLARAMKTMYRGNLLMVGHSYNPWDVLILNDRQNDVKGPVEIQRVVHSFDTVNGWTSDITPHLVTTANSKASILRLAKQNMFFNGVEGAIDTVFWIWTIATLGTAAASGAAVAARGASKAAIKKIASGMMKERSAAVISRRGLAGLLSGLLKSKRRGISAKILAQVAKQSLSRVKYGQLGKELSRTFFRYLNKEGLQMLWKDGVEDLAFSTAFIDQYREGALPVLAAPLKKEGTPFVAGIRSELVLYSSANLMYNLRVAYDDFSTWLRDTLSAI